MSWKLNKLINIFRAIGFVFVKQEQQKILLTQFYPLLTPR